MTCIRTILAPCALLAIAPAPEQLIGDFVLDRRAYTSPSGEVTLVVDPSQRSGAGEATYRVTRGDVELWSGTRPYTLWRAAVTDDGLVAGYAYGVGYEGGRSGDSFTVVLLEPDGTARLEERHDRTGHASDIGMPEPLAVGMFVDPENDRLVLRMRAGEWGGQTWWTYSLSSGQPGPRLDPRAGMGEDEHLFMILGARALSDTPLVLVNWAWMDLSAGDEGAVFALLDPQGKVVWRLDWPRDLTVPGDREATQRRFHDVRDEGTILATGAARFTLRRMATDEAVSFAVERVPGTRERWEVREVERVPFRGAADAQRSGGRDQVAELGLTHLGAIAIGSPPAGVVREVKDFALDGFGRLGFLRGTNERMDLVRIDPDGQNATEVALPAPPRGTTWERALAWTAGERWVVVASTLPGNARDAWWIDVANAAVTPIEDFAAPQVEALAGAPDGGFVVAGTTWDPSGYFTNDLVAFDAAGRRRLALGGDQGFPDRPQGLSMCEGVTVLSNGDIVVLTSHGLKVFASDGRFRRAIDLAAALGHQPNNPAGVRRDVDDGILVRDLGGEPSIVRLDAQDRLAGGLDPRLPDGKPLAGFDVLAAADGRLWTTDGRALYELDRQGATERCLGKAPDATALGDVARLALGPEDRIHALDQRAGAVHVFRADGTPLHVWTLAPGDPDLLGASSLRVEATGDVFVGNVRFGPDGTRIGPAPLQVAGGRAFRLGGRWGTSSKGLMLFDAAEEPVRTIERAPDGTWLRRIASAAVASDGSIAIATDALFGRTALHVFSAQGEPLRTLVPPQHMVTWCPLAFDGTRLAVAFRDEERPGVALMDVTGLTLGHFRPESPRDAGANLIWRPFFAAGGEELWLFDGQRTIERFALP